MWAAAIVAPGRVELREVPEPSPGPGEVKVRIKHVGVCGSELKSYVGSNPLVTYPRIPGHEASGEIVELGPGVSMNIKTGMNVALYPYTSCGDCPACLKRQQNACCHNQTLGVQRDGVMTEYAVMPWQTVMFPSEKLSPQELALVEPLAVGFHAIAQGKVESSDTVAVFGCGAVGLGAVMGAAFRGARVIAIGRNDAKLGLAREVGASETINSNRQELGPALYELTGYGPSVIVEAVGDANVSQAATELVAPCGRVVIVGYAKETTLVDTARDVVRKQADIIGSRNATTHDFSGVIRMLEGGRFPAKKLVTQVVSLEGVGEALLGWSKNTSKVVRIMVNMTA